MAQSKQPETDFPVLRTLGLRGMLVTFGDKLEESANRAAIAYRAAVEAAEIAGIYETSMSLTSVFVSFDPLETPHDQMRAHLDEILAQDDWFAADLPAGRRLWRIPTVFGTDLAPQFDEAAEAAGLSPDAALEQLTEARVRVMTIGFAPGQPYLGELGPDWNIPRQKTLTPKVPQGALIVAIRQLVLFTAPAPTGWRHIGQTAFRTFRQDADDPFSLRPGDEITFDPIKPEDLTRIRETRDDSNGGAVPEVIQ